LSEGSELARRILVVFDPEYGERLHDLKDCQQTGIGFVTCSKDDASHLWGVYRHKPQVDD
jgi:hypothetical protein